MRVLSRVGVPSWFAALGAVSVLLLVATQLSYALVGHGLVSAALFWIGLGGENNIGSWWSGMLLALAAVFAFDGLFDSEKPRCERRGWCSLGLALLLLSFDEVASLHEYLAAHSLVGLAMLGAAGLALAGYAMAQLHRARVRPRTLRLLLIGFALLATVPLHELAQKQLEWRNPVVYGVRALFEEGTEVGAMLIFVWALRLNSAAALRRATGLFAVAARRRIICIGGLALWPFLTAATFVLPHPGGPADWLASLLLLLCALLAVRSGLLNGGLNARTWLLVVFYLTASAAANASGLAWHPPVLGMPVSARGVMLGLEVAAAAVLLTTSGRRVNVRRVLLIALVIVGGAAAWPASQLLWCALPPLVALWVYSVESKGIIVKDVPSATRIAAAA
jgi:hypothetical protein